MIDEQTKSLLQQHRTAALNWWPPRLPWQSDPNDYLDTIDSTAEALCSGNALAADTLANDINQAHLALTTNAQVGFDGIQTDMEAWAGTAADNFRDYMSKVKQAMARYDQVLNDFKRVQDGYTALVGGCVTDVQNLLNKAIDAQNGVSAETWQVALTAIGGVAAIIGSAISGPVGWEILLGGVALATSEGSVLISTNGHGETAKSLLDGLQSLLESVINQRENFYYAVQQLDNVVMENVDNNNLGVVEPSPPTIITAPNFDPSTFDLPSDIEPLGIENGVSRGPLVARNQQSNSQISTRLAGG
jgi:uncharacterized protein YukE